MVQMHVKVGGSTPPRIDMIKTRHGTAFELIPVGASKRVSCQKLALLCLHSFVLKRTG